MIPRFAGDVADPRGGIRHVIPGTGNYLAAPPPGDPDETHDPMSEGVALQAFA